MADRKKKMAAALAAVDTYLQQEQEGAAEQGIQQASAVDYRPIPSQWGHSGRQEMMAMRRLIQLRTFDRFR